MQAAVVIEVPGDQLMNVTARVRATHLSKLRFAKPSWQHQATSVALAVGAFVMGYAPLESPINARTESGVAAGISSDPNAKSAREQKRAERAAARDAKKKERASRSNKSDDRSLAKAKSGKGSSSGSSVDLGDNDPLEGL
jgi:hypothetical protein